MIHNWKRKLLGGLSLTSALFIFQACYGTPQDMGMDILIEGRVRSMKTSLPVKGIKISVVDKMQYQISDEDGNFSFYTENDSVYNIKIEDIDNTQNGSFAGKDTTLTSIDRSVYLDILLEEK